MERRITSFLLICTHPVPLGGVERGLSDTMVVTHFLQEATSDFPGVSAGVMASEPSLHRGSGHHVLAVASLEDSLPSALVLLSVSALLQIHTLGITSVPLEH